MKMKVGATALLMSLMAIDRAIAGYTVITYPPKPAVPEFDGPGAIAAIALLAGIASIVLQKSRRS